jgi:hypothetical protein
VAPVTFTVVTRRLRAALRERGFILLSFRVSVQRGGWKREVTSWWPGRDRERGERGKRQRENACLASSLVPFSPIQVPACGTVTPTPWWAVLRNLPQTHPWASALLKPIKLAAKVDRHTVPKWSPWLPGTGLTVSTHSHACLGRVSVSRMSPHTGPAPRPHEDGGMEKVESLSQGCPLTGSVHTLSRLKDEVWGRLCHAEDVMGDVKQSSVPTG